MRRVELLEPVEEERTLLREEQRLPRIDHELAGVRLHLGEIGPHGAVEREIVRDAPPHVAAELRRARCVTPSRPAAGAPVDLPRHDRIEVEHESAVESGQAVERSRLPEERRVRRASPAPSESS